MGVVPDMAVFAKSISNGYPMAAVVGKRAVMEPAARMFISSTYWSDAIGLVAALTTLRELRRRNACAHIQHIGQSLLQAIGQALTDAGLPGSCAGLPVHPAIRLAIDDSETLRKLNTLYIQEMCRRGCLGYTSFYLSAAHSDADVQATVSAARDTFTLIRDGLDRGRLDAMLECELTQDSFRRLVR